MTERGRRGDSMHGASAFSISGPLRSSRAESTESTLWDRADKAFTSSSSFYSTGDAG